MNVQVTLSIGASLGILVACSSAEGPSTLKPMKEKEVAAVVPTQVEPADGHTDATSASASQASAAANPPPAFVRITEPLLADSPDKIEFTKTTWALATPFKDGARLGLVSGNKPIAIRSHVINEDCETPWIEVAPQGFVCMEVRAARLAKKSKAKKRKGKRRALIGSYAIAAKGARFFKSMKAAEAGTGGRPARGDMLRLGKSVTLEDGRKFRKTDRGEYISTTDIRRLWGSKWAGTELPLNLEQPVAFAVNSRRVKSPVKVYREPNSSSRRAGKLKARTLVSLEEISEDEMFARVGENRWVRRVDLRQIDVQEPPADLDNTGRWADVDLDNQLVVVYEGKRPVFATLASTGREKDRTPTGVFRVTRKKRRTTMRSDRSRRQTYSAAVPWSTYFHEGIAFHTAYWHDSFGKARSHGCINLSPSDAKTVYDLLGPEVPEGWSVVYGHESQLGSVVQVRSARPNPVPEKEEEEA